MLECQLCRLVEQDVDDDPLGGRENDRLDELFLLAAAAVAADELHLRARKRDVEDARVRGVRQVDPNDLVLLRVEGKVGLAGDEQHVAEPPHRSVVGLRWAEGSDRTVLEQDVVEGQEQFAVAGGQ